MFFSILKHDFKKKKTMNIILLLFITLATIFSASGINNIVTVMNATDYYLDKAGIGDYVVLLHNNSEEIQEVLDNEKTIKRYSSDEFYMGSKNNININNKKIETKNTMLFQSIEHSSINFFDQNDKEITSIAEGEAYITGNFIDNNNLSIGDEITIDFGENKIQLKIIGKAKDALLGSDFMGNKRILMNNLDYEKLTKDNPIPDTLKGKIFYICTDDINKLESSLSNAENILFTGTKSNIKLCYVMDMIVACIVLVLSICLIIVALLVLKFTITFTISEEFREIGVMKAIGIKNQKIRNLYIVKYMMLSIIGAVIGYFISIPFGKLLIGSVTDNMVLGNYGGITLNIIGSIFIIVIIILFAYICTKKVKKLSPVDAIRNGQTGERYKKKTIYRIEKSHIRPNLYLAINDILSSPKRFFIIIIALFVCMVFVLGIVITTDTMKSKNLITTFSTESDIYFLPNDILEISTFKEKEELDKYLEKYSELFKENGMPCTLCTEINFKNKVIFDGNTYSCTCQQGVNTKTTEYEYLEGSAPINSNEIAITKLISNKIGAKIGDTLTIDFGNEKRDFIVTAYFQSLSQLRRINKATRRYTN